MSRFLWITLMFLGLGLIACSGCGSSTPAEELKKLDPTERQALTDLLEGTGLSPEQLRPIGILGIDRNPRALAVEGGHIVGLRLSGVTVANLTPLKQLPSLQVLWLTECTLPSLGGLAGQGALRDLSLARSGLGTSDGIADLPRLTELDLDDNKLPSLSGLKGLPALKKVSARNNAIVEHPSLGKNVVLVLDGNPVAKPAVTASDTPGPDPTGKVSRLPKQDGKTTGRGPHQRGGPLSSSNFEASGIYDSVTGAVTLGMAKIESSDSTVNAEVSVEQGRVRLYLEDQSRKSYSYAEATPGHPARLTGRMPTSVTTFGIVLESVEGTASGVRYHVIRAAR